MEATVSESDMEIARYEEQRERMYLEWCRQNLVDPIEQESAAAYERWFDEEAYNRQVADEERYDFINHLDDDDYYGHG
jgi:hypothetical protein